MKKSLKGIAVCLVLLLSVPVIKTQAQLFDKGDVVLSAGLGLGSTYYTLGTYYKTTIPPIFFMGDYCLREDLGPGNLGIGGYLGFSGYKYEYPLSDWNVKYTTVTFGVRGTYHFTDLVEKLDLYGGIMIGAEIVSAKVSDDELDNYYSADGSGVGYDVFAGARYYFTDNLAVMGELGYGIAWLKIGVSFKL